MAKILVGGTNEGTAFAIVDSAARACPTADCAGLHLDENERFTIAENQVDLAVFAGKIRSEELQAVLLQVITRGHLPQGATL